MKRAMKVIPLGVSSNFRYWGEDETPVISRAEGGYMWDVDGNRYIDYRLGYGPIILGHANEEVDNHVRESIADGTVYAFTTEREIRVAEKMVEMVPGLDMVRFSNSGTEATMHAIRLARAYTGREKVVKFEGQYHGMYDYVLWSTSGAEASMLGNKRSPIPLSSSSGIPNAIRELIITLPFNDFEGVEYTLKQSWFDIACIIAEPMLGNAASIEPMPGFLEHLRKLCDEYGIVFIMDEVKTGFRVARGGAQELYNVSPDLATYAKSMGNGYPVAAFGGKREIMDHVGKGVAHGGTYTGNNVAMAAAEKTLEILSTTPALEDVAERGKQLQKGISDILEAHSMPFVFTGHPSMFGVTFAENQPQDFRDWAASNHALYNAILEALVKRGAMPEPDSLEPWFFCRAHSQQDIDDTLTAFKESVDEVLGGTVEERGALERQPGGER
jgi:glutamate-1-semialdehyde 2,1-aminomutase